MKSQTRCHGVISHGRGKVDAQEDWVGGDGAADVLRYLVATKPRTVS